ncbi:MAG: Bug family tripartite tricarboxylate transporter substrate binding protein [Peptococcaceae bacterium]
MLRGRRKALIWLCGLIAITLVLFGCSGQDAKQEAKDEPQQGQAENSEASWPTKEIEVVYHSKAGSGGDIFLRAMGKAAEPMLGQPWVVNNLTGASGANAWDYVAKAAPDGYTILGMSSTIVTSPLQNKMPISYQDFDPVAMMFIDPIVIFVPADSPYQTLGEMIEAARQEPGKLKWAGGTAGNIEFVGARELMKVADFKASLVPFEGGGDAVVSVLGGHLDAGIGEYAEMKASVEAGKIRILATFNLLPDNPDIQTVEEAGYPEVKLEKFRGIFVPKGTPAEIIDRLVEVMKDVYHDPDFKRYYEEGNLIPAFAAKEEFTKVIENQYKQVEESLKNIN